MTPPVPLVTPPSNRRVPPDPTSLESEPLLVSGPARIDVLPQLVLVSDTAPWPPIVVPFVVVTVTLAEHVLAIASVCVPDVPPIWMVLTVGLPPPLSSSVTVYVPLALMQTLSVLAGA